MAGVGRNNTTLLRYHHMSNAKETIKAIQSSHSTLFVVMATAIALLFTSPVTDYREALNEAYVLQALRMSEYESFAKSATPGNYMLPRSEPFKPGDWDGEITSFLNGILGWKVSEFSFPRHEIYPILQYEKPPTSGSVKDWFKWISSTDSVKYWQPNWDEARLSASREKPITDPIVRFFILEPSVFRRSPNEYTFRAFLDFNVTDKDKSTYAHLSTDVVDDWWSELAANGVRKRWGMESKDNPLRSAERFVVEGDVYGELREGTKNSGIRNWLESSGAWEKLTRTNDLGETILPGIRKHWSEISEKSLDDAVGFMEREMNKIQDVSVFGVPIPGRLCVVAIPVAFLIVTLHMLLKMRRLVTMKDGVTTDAIDESPWIGLYNDVLAVRVTDYSFLLLPTALSLAVIIKYYERVDLLANAVGIGFVVVTLVCCVALVRNLKEVRDNVLIENRPTSGSS